MNQSLAQHLATRLAALPFADPAAGARVCGLARLYTGQVAGADAPVVKLPVPATFTAAACEADSRYLVPDATTPLIAFFEDYGTVDYAIAPHVYGKESTLRLLLWLNPARLSGPLSESQLIQAIETALSVRRRFTVGEYTQLLITATVLPAETSLFGRYTFDTETPLLLPPFRLLGLELKCRYLPAPACPVADLPTLLPATQCLSIPSSSSFTPRS